MAVTVSQLFCSLGIDQYATVRNQDMVKNNPDFFRAGRRAIYTSTDTMAEVTALMEVEATFQARVSSAAGFPKMTNL